MKDVICGMKVDKKSPYKSEYNGEEYYFCSKHCKEEFDKNPIKYTR
ncbi:MAG: YHS domain-containing protein [Thermoplasmata archaeon]